MRCAAIAALVGALATLTGSAEGHGQMVWPTVRPDADGNTESFLNFQPVAGVVNGPRYEHYGAQSGMRCRDRPGPSEITTLTAGETFALRIKLNAMHYGDCSAWISYDCVDVAGACEPVYFFKIQDFPGCGGTAESPNPPSDYTLDTLLPAELPACSRCVLRWDWVALHTVGGGDTENYAICADIDIISDSGPVVPDPFIAINGLEYMPSVLSEYRSVPAQQGPGLEWLVGPAAATYTPCTGTEVGCVSSSGVVPPPTTTLLPSPPYTAAPTVFDPTLPCVERFGKCGGAGYTGSGRCCDAADECTFGSIYYSSCQAATAPPAPTTATPTDAPVTSGPTSAPVTSPPTTAAPSLGPTTGVPSTAPVTSPPSATACSPEWGQCAGLTWTGPTCCEEGLLCVYDNDYYSQCRASTSAPTTKSPTSAPVTSPPTTAAPSLGPTTGVPSTAPVTSPPSATACSPEWGQCAGLTWNGPTCCEEGLSCVYNNDYYSQCLKSSSPSPPAPTPPTPLSSCANLYGQCGGQTFNGPTCCAEGTCTFSNAHYSQCLP